MKVLYILSSYNLYGGTPKKTLDLMKYFKKKSSLYVYYNNFPELKGKFENTGGSVHEGYYGWNIYRHLRKLLNIIDNEEIDVIQTQFSMGEVLGFLVKLLRPNIKLVVAFVASIKPSKIKEVIVNFIYHKVDAFVYISNYVKKEKLKQFAILKDKKCKIIYNGSHIRKDNGESVANMRRFALLDIAGLIKLKNIQVLIEACNILVNEKKEKNIFLYVAGDGPYKKELEKLIKKYSLDDHISLLGYISNVGKMLSDCDIFVHPSYAEGFGIAVAEAMHAGRPIIVSNAGALPELIEDEKSGLVVDPHSAEEWAAAILRIINKKQFADKISENAKKEAEQKFSIENYCKNYENLYKSLTATE